MSLHGIFWTANLLDQLQLEISVACLDQDYLILFFYKLKPW